MNEVIVCIKIFGSTLILSSGFLMGAIYAGEIGRRYESLCEFRRSFLLMKADISYGGTSLSEVFRHVKEQTQGIYYQWFAYLEKETGECFQKHFEEIWDHSIQESLDCEVLKQEDLNELYILGRNMGGVNRDQQITMLELYLNKLEYTIQVLEAEKVQKQKLCHILGIATSIFVVVLLV